MTVYELIQKLTEFSPDAKVEFQFIPDGEVRVELDNMKIDGDAVIIPQHGVMLAYQNLVWYGGSGPIVINLKSKY